MDSTVDYDTPQGIRVGIRSRSRVAWFYFWFATDHWSCNVEMYDHNVSENPVFEL